MTKDSKKAILTQVYSFDEKWEELLNNKDFVKDF